MDRVHKESIESEIRGGGKVEEQTTHTHKIEETGNRYKDQDIYSLDKLINSFDSCEITVLHKRASSQMR